MAFINSPLNFKPNVNRLTEYRISLVMKYIIYCYSEMVKDNKKYDFSSIGKLQKEDFLRNGLVDEYLSRQRYKNFYKYNISDNPLVEIYFQKEENQVYYLGEFSDDYIDISVKETKLSEILSGESEDEIRFAIECKRVNGSSDYNEYIKDIQKFTDRKFTTFRIPYEGQIAFIENKLIGHEKMSLEINDRLKNSKRITTVGNLSQMQLDNVFLGSYLSAHRRNYTPNSSFSIFHLFFDYSQSVLN